MCTVRIAIQSHSVILWSVWFHRPDCEEKIFMHISWSGWIHMCACCTMISLFLNIFALLLMRQFWFYEVWMNDVYAALIREILLPNSGFGIWIVIWNVKLIWWNCIEVSNFMHFLGLYTFLFECFMNDLFLNHQCNSFFELMGHWCHILYVLFWYEAPVLEWLRIFDRICISC